MSLPEGNLFRRAYELAYFIHPHSQLALQVAESALHKLDHSFGRQGRRTVYVPSGGMRTKVTLREEHLLQLLIYAESDPWERSSEQGTGPYPVTEEDMVIRFIKHLVQITVKRNSFYVTLGIGRLLFEYDTSQVRQMYDVLMQDHARFRDNSYLRRQKNVLLREILGRFEQMVRTVKTTQNEDRFQTQPTTELLLRQVRESLRRFIPWGTACIFPEKFDPVGKIPAFAFAGPGPDDESPVEMNRIHTIIDPACFIRLVTSLSFPPPDQQLAVPQFFYSEDNQPPGDRFNPPHISAEQETRLKKSLAESGRRRKAYRGGQLRIYVDDVEVCSFDPVRGNKAQLKVASDANLIEVRGQDVNGEFTLATMVAPFSSVPAGGSMEDFLTLEGGQQLSVVIKDRESDEFEVEIGYAETHPLRILSSWLMGFTGGPRRLAYVGVVVLILVLIALLVLWQQRVRPVQVPDEQVVNVPTPTPIASPEPSPIQSPVPRPQNPLVAWSRDPDSVDRAIRIELRRGGAPAIEISSTAKLLLAVNRVSAESERYQRYRIVLSGGEQTIWERVLPAPKWTLNARVHVISLDLSSRPLPPAASYRLRVDGETKAGWENLGDIVLQRR